MSDPKKPETLNAIDAYWIASPGIKGFAIKILRRIRRHYRKRCKKYHYIFIHEGPFGPVIDPPCEIARYKNFEDIPSTVKEQILDSEGKRSLDIAQFEMNHAASMWCGYVDGQLSNYMFSRFGKDFKRWFINLEDNDIVFFRVKTFPEYRGYGLYGIVARYIMHALLHNGGMAFVDCDIHNKSSIRAHSKAGFRILYKMKPITIEQALGVRLLSS